MKTTPMVCGLASLLLSTQCYAHLDSIGEFTTPQTLSVETAGAYVVKSQQNKHLVYLNQYGALQFIDDGAVFADGHFTLENGAVQWHLTDTVYRLRYVLVETGYKSYRLYSVSADDAQDSGEPQFLSNEINTKDFKGEAGIGNVFFYGVTDSETSAALGESIFVGGGAPTGGGTCVPHAPHSPHPSPTVPIIDHTPPPTRTPCHPVPETGSTFVLLLTTLAACVVARFKRL